MLNGLLNLCYKELVKGKLQNLNNQNYNIVKQPSKLMEKIDFIFIKIFKALIAFLFLLFTFNLNIYLGIVLFFIMVALNISIIKNNIKKMYDDIKNKTKNIIDKKVKSQCTSLIMLIGLYFFCEYKKLYISIFILLLIFTIWTIYSNINNNTEK